jgi:hypothetical protein
MTLKALLDKLDGLDEPLRAHYVETEDGKFRLDVAPVGGWQLDDVGGLKTKLSRATAKTSELAAKLAAFNGVLGGESDEEKILTPERVKAIAEELAHLKASQSEDVKAQIASAIAQTEAKWKAQEQRWVKERGELERARGEAIGQLQRELVRTAAMGAIAKHRGSAKLLLPVVEGLTRMVEEEGRYVARVLSPDGNVRLTQRTGSSDPMTIDELVESMRDDQDYARAFESKGATGTGATGAERTGSGNGIIDPNLSPTDRRAAYYEQKYGRSGTGKV